MAEPSATTAAAAAAERDLLATKLHVPQTRPGFVTRPRLVDRLAPTQEGALTLVCAPAGFGKTALLADWARHDPRPIAWLSLDEGDNDPARFWRYVSAALDRVRPGLGERMAASPGSSEAVVAALVNQLADESDPVVLVLDDFHVIEAPPVHQSVEALLAHLPPRLRLVLASRSDPPLALARLRASGQLTELRAAELRFTPEEAEALLREAVGTDLPEGAATALTRRTEGWAVGLQLAALSLRSHRDPAGFVASLTGSHRWVLDYLTEEVLARQPAELVQFLLETSILERLSGPLCDAVCGRDDSQRLLEQVERANLFLQPLDEQRRWWRYHQLFADLLRARLNQQRPERVPELHRAAAAWFEAHGLVEEAVRHAMAAGEVAWVARLMEQHFPWLLWASEDTTLRRWLAELPASVVREPVLCVALASRAAMGGRLEEAERLLVAAERAPTAAGPEGPPVGAAVRLADDLPSAIAMLRANFARIHGDAGPATRFARQAQATLAGDDPLTRAAVEWNLAQADLLGGRLEAVEHALTRVAAGYRAAGVPVLAAAVCYDLAQVQHGLGRLGAAIDTCRQALELAGAVDPDLPPAGAAHARLAELLRERDELDAALDHAIRGVELCRRREFAWPLAVGLATLAWIRQAQGDPAGARAAMAEATQALPDPRLIDLFNPAPAQAARLALAQGRTTDAVRWVRDRGLDLAQEPSYPREREYLVLVRVLLAEQGPEQALGLLERLHAMAAAQKRTGSLVEIRVLQALALSAASDRPGALAALVEALALGAPEGYLRVFLDEGPPMAALLHELLVDRRHERLAAAGAPRAYLARLAEAFEQAGLPIRPALRRGGVVVAGLVEPLTARELEVLGLLAAGAPNRSIAEQLVVTQETVKKHLSHLFDKLGAANRTQAVARARQLGLLP
jgi:LuxR family transcriptional regulator, maltose regulon positive regulatory protein